MLTRSSGQLEDLKMLVESTVRFCNVLYPSKLHLNGLQKGTCQGLYPLNFPNITKHQAPNTIFTGTGHRQMEDPNKIHLESRDRRGAGQRDVP